MNSRTGLKKVAAGMVIGGALTLTSAFSGVAFASEDINIGVGELQECTISKSMDGNLDGQVDGLDFVDCHQGTSASIGVGDLADWEANYGAVSADSSQSTTSGSEWKYVSVRR